MLLAGLYAALRNRRGEKGRIRSAGFRPLGIFCLFVMGFLIVYLPVQWYFYGITGDLPAPERMRAYAAVQDANSSLDFMKYPRAMLNIESDLYQWPHRIPACGFMYWAFFIATPLMLCRREKRLESCYVLLWAYGFIFFCQYFLYLFATYISPKPVVQPRHLRFLLLVSPPVSMGIAVALNAFFRTSDRQPMRCAGHIATAFLVVSSLTYAYGGARFLRTGMADLRRAADFIAAGTDKPIYLPDKWSLYKLRFFGGYAPAFLKKDLRLYRCGPFRLHQAPYG